MTTGERLAVARKAAGLTQSQLGDRAGTSKQAISHLERGQDKASLDLLYKLAVALGCDPSSLDDRLAPARPSA